MGNYKASNGAQEQENVDKKGLASGSMVAMNFVHISDNIRPYDDGDNVWNYPNKRIHNTGSGKRYHKHSNNCILD
jgi:hypothetical protein